MSQRRRLVVSWCTAVCAAALLLAGAPATALAAPAPRRSGAAPAERLLTCQRRPVVQPTTFVIACADANEELLGLRWQAWNTGAASATGTYLMNTCTPTCAAGTFVRYSAQVELTGALQTSLGVLYQRLVWHYRAAGKEHREAFALLPVPERVGTCSGSSVVRPAQYTIACADANERLAGLRWRSWDAGVASATATYLVNTCTPTCAAGRFVRYPATVELSGARFSSEDGLLFTTLHWQYAVRGVIHREVAPLPG